MEAHDVRLKEVVIQDLQDGVFYAVLVFERDGEERTTDARPSDAIALALRADCPIYASHSVMEKASLAESEAKVASVQGDTNEDEIPDGDPLETPETAQALGKATVETLNEWLERALEQEDYELAARIRDELNKR
jgi:bifunctional DNase/RNase